MSNPLAEVFGFPIQNQTDRARQYRQHRLCPFNNGEANCTKTRADDPLGVCSVFHHEQPVITCPVRFREDWQLLRDASAFFFPSGTAWTSLGEVRLKDRDGKSVGNIDYVLVAYDDRGRVLDFASLEVQAVYISGNLGGAFKTYMEVQTAEFDWRGALNYPHPDYLSSSKKRLAPQLVSKGSIMNFWGKKQAVAIQTSFYNTLPALPEVSQEDADLAWFLYDLVMDEGQKQFRLTLNRTIYTRYEDALLRLNSNEPGDLATFVEQLQTKLTRRLATGNKAPFMGDADGDPTDL
jgi:hypothetical protein